LISGYPVSSSSLPRPSCHHPLPTRPQECNAEIEGLRRERLAHEEALRAAAAQAKALEIRQIRLDAAAAAIQNAWKSLKKRRAADAKAKSKKGKAAAGGAKAAPAGKKTRK